MTRHDNVSGLLSSRWHRSLLNYSECVEISKCLTVEYNKSPNSQFVN